MSQTTLQRLLKYPHSAVFDKSPGEELALRLRHPDGAAWTVAEEVLTVTVGAATTEYPLPDYTVASLANALRAAGFEVQSVAPAFAHLSALVLIEGAGDQRQSNGDQLKAYTSLLWALYGGYSREVRDAKDQVAQALRQMIVPQAEGEWLDLWGSLYAVPRLQDESDAQYVPRIPREAFRVRVNARAIEQAILDETGFDVRIEEPWTQVFTLDQSALSGGDALYDGESYGYHLIRPVAYSSVDWRKVLPVIERNRAAGVLVVSPEGLNVSVLYANGASVVSGITRNAGRHTSYIDRTRLDESNIEDVSILNYPARIISEVSRFSSLVAVAGYVVPASLHTRDYRNRGSLVAYSGRSWASTNITWAAAKTTWQGLTVIVRSAHSSSGS